MRHTVLTLLLAAFAIHSALAQETKVITNCPLLETKEAAAFLGPGTGLPSAIETAHPKVRTYQCSFLSGGKYLHVRTFPVPDPNPANSRKLWETLRQAAGETVEPGLGGYAYSSFDETANIGSAKMSVLKGLVSLEIEYRGRGVTKADVGKVREVAKKVTPRL